MNTFELVIDRIYRAIFLVLHWLVGYGAAFILLGATLLAIVEIVRRYVFGLVFEWGQDAVIYISVASMFLFFAVTQARRSHLAVTAAVDLLRERGHEKLVLAIRAVISLIGVVLWGFFAWWGIPTLERTMMMERTTQSMLLQVWPFQLALIIGFALMSLVCVFQCYQDIQEIRGKKVFPWAPVEEGIQI
jgi:C4-dicarboxylate transporter DctQ subunit